MADTMDEMELHQDVFWLGRRSAVTGYGIQADSTQFAMRHDIQVADLGDNGEERLLPESWFDLEDFREAIAVARQRSLESPLSFCPPPGNER